MEAYPSIDEGGCSRRGGLFAFLHLAQACLSNLSLDFTLAPILSLASARSHLSNFLSSIRHRRNNATPAAAGLAEAKSCSHLLPDHDKAHHGYSTSLFDTATMIYAASLQMLGCFLTFL